MGKLSVYVPDDLLARAQAAGLEKSAVCQRALEAALVRVSPMGDGWARLQLAGAEAAVRFDAADGTRLTAREVVIAGDLTDDALRAVRVRALEEWANGDAHDEMLRGVKDRAASPTGDVTARAMPATRATWGTGEDAVADLRRRGIEGQT